MIEGAEVLKKTELFNSEPSLFTMILGLILLIFLIVITVWLIRSINTKKIFGSILLVLMVGLMGFLALPWSYKDVSTGFEYEVQTENAEVIKALYENYEIIEVNGDIYTVREKTE